MHFNISYSHIPGPLSHPPRLSRSNFYRRVPPAWLSPQFTLVPPREEPAPAPAPAAPAPAPAMRMVMPNPNAMPEIAWRAAPTAAGAACVPPADNRPVERLGWCTAERMRMQELQNHEGIVDHDTSCGSQSSTPGVLIEQLAQMLPPGTPGLPPRVAACASAGSAGGGGGGGGGGDGREGLMQPPQPSRLAQQPGGRSPTAIKEYGSGNSVEAAQGWTSRVGQRSERRGSKERS